MRGFQPECIPTDPEPLVTAVQRASELLAPAARDCLQVEPVVFEIPLPPKQHLKSPVREAPLKIDYASAQRVPCILDRYWRGDRPDAKFVAPQASPEIGDAGVEQVLRGFVENANVRAPRHVADDPDSGPA